MATSGNDSFALTTGTLIKHIFVKLGLLSPDDEVPGNDYEHVRVALNMMVKAWPTSGVYLHLHTDAVCLLDAGKASYKISSSGDRVSEDIIKTTTDTATAISDTVIPVTSTEDIEVGDNIGIVINSTTTFWSTVASISSGVSVTINDAMTSASTSGSNVYVYTSKLNRPFDVVQCGIIDTNGNYRKLEPYTREEYNNISNKTQAGEPSIYYVERKRDFTKLHFHPVPNNETSRILLTFKKTIQDFTFSSDEPDLPQEWLAALMLNGAVFVSSDYGKGRKALTEIQPLASSHLIALKSWDKEHVATYFTPSRGGRRGGSGGRIGR
jgi:hypothetical protein